MLRSDTMNPMQRHLDIFCKKRAQSIHKFINSLWVCSKLKKLKRCVLNVCSWYAVYFIEFDGGYFRIEIQQDKFVNIALYLIKTINNKKEKGILNNWKEIKTRVYASKERVELVKDQGDNLLKGNVTIHCRFLYKLEKIWAIPNKKEYLKRLKNVFFVPENER